MVEISQNQSQKKRRKHMAYKLMRVIMKIPIYIKQPLTQIFVYILLYELILWILKFNNLINLNISIGISSRYLFYLFLLFSFILSIILFLKKESKLSYIITLAVLYTITSVIFFGIKSKLIIIILVISIFSFFASHFANSIKLRR